MKSIVELKWDNTLSIMESIELIDKGKYYNNPEYYQKLVKEYKRPYDCRKWLKSE